MQPLVPKQVLELEVLCVAMLCPITSILRVAEEGYEKWIENVSLDVVVLTFRQVLRTTPVPSVRSVCMVLLRLLLREKV